MNFLVTFYLIQLKTDSCINPIHPSALHINKTSDQEKRKLQRKLGKKKQRCSEPTPSGCPTGPVRYFGLALCFRHGRGSQRLSHLMLGCCILRHYDFRRRDNSFKAIKVIKFSWRMLLFDQAPEEENTFMAPML